MITCKECGTSYQEFEKVCPECGANVTLVCNKCNKPMESISDICKCGGFPIKNSIKSKKKVEYDYSDEFEYIDRYIFLYVIFQISACVIFALDFIILSALMDKDLSNGMRNFIVWVNVIGFFAYCIITICFKTLGPRCPYCDERIYLDRRLRNVNNCASCGGKLR